MKSLLFCVAALLVGLPVQSETISAHSENKTSSVWLILVLHPMGNAAMPSQFNSMIKIPMNDMNQCEEQGASFKASQKVQSWFLEGREYICLEGASR